MTNPKLTGYGVTVHRNMMSIGMARRLEPPTLTEEAEVMRLW